MIIGVDGNEANVKNQVGVSVYTKNLLYWFAKSADKNTRFKIFLRQPPLDFLPKENQFFKYKVIRAGFLWSQLFLPLTLYLTNRVDVFFSPAHYSPRFCPCPTIVTVHDLSYFYYPEEFLKKDLYQLKNWTSYSILQAKKVISVSKTTKKDLMNFYHLPEEKIEVIYNGYEKQIQNPKSKSQHYISKLKPYILFVGTIQPRKNITVLIDAYAKLLEKYPDFRLIIAGKKGWLYEKIFDKVRRLNLKNKIIFAGHVSDEKLIDLYKDAFCFVIPSLYEGFGIPILEAMAYNCPVIASFASSLPEVGGEACLYFDPESPDDLLEKINQLLDSNELRNDLIKKGAGRIKSFSWKKSALATLEVLKSVYDKNNH